MTRLLVLCGAVLLLSAAAPLAGAAEPDKSDPAAQVAKAAEIVVDQKAGTVRILIDGQAIVVIDAEGLHVGGDITYTDVIRDTGHLATQAEGGGDE